MNRRLRIYNYNRGKEIKIGRKKKRKEKYLMEDEKR